MDHPCVVTLDRDSAPRTVFSGDQLIDIDLPAGTRVIYPKPPLSPLGDVDAAIRYALSHPEDSEPLYALLRPGMQITIAIDDISLPLPPMKRPDIRERVLSIVLEMLSDHGVDDVHIIVATGIHRRMKPAEIRHIVGDKIYDAYAPDRLYNHDAEDHDNMVVIGETERGEVIDLNRRAAESDLIIYVNLNFVPMNGGYKSVAVGLTSYRSLRHHHNPDTIRASDSYMDPENSALANDIARLGKVVHENLKIFNIESTVNNQMFDPALDFLRKNEDDFPTKETARNRAAVAATARLPQGLRHTVFDKFPAPYGVTGVWAGNVEAVHKKVVERS